MIFFMEDFRQMLILVLVLAGSLSAQTTHLWVLRAPGEMVEYDPATFALKQTVKVPAEAVKSPANLQVNRSGQMLFAPAITLPLSDDDADSPHKVWLWNGHAASTLDQGVARKTEDRGSNKEISEIAPMAFLSSDGSHLYWSGNDTRRLEREEIDLSTQTTWQAWRTDLTGGAREEIASSKLPDCRCPTGSCEESCPTGVAWAPDGGVENFFLLTQYVAGQTTPTYKASARYQEDGGTWTSQALPEPLQRVLDADSGGNVIVEAIPDTGCCGWSNQSNDQTLVLSNGKKITIFDEFATYKNPDYDVSFSTANARLSPEMDLVAMTITATAQANKPIQLSQQGQANPEESKAIQKSLTEVPAVAVKSVEDSPRQVAFVPHATLVGWISEKELLLVEDHLLVAYHLGTGARRKSTVRVDDAAHVFLR
jgi:hypothetical protein